MNDAQAKTKLELERFFSGLQAGLNSLREVRDTYDEQVAFEFNMFRFFTPSETKLSEILAFFLDPKQKHGQKSAFLRVFLEHFGLSDSVNTLLESDQHITVKCEDQTQYGRFIDVTVHFGGASFVVGIENKIYARDQDQQLHDYCIELEKRTHGNYRLLYLTPDGRRPAEHSIKAEKLVSLSDKIQIVSYGKLIELLEKYETVCRAGNVREFIRQFHQYLKQKYFGETFMGEIDFVTDYLRENPIVLKHLDALNAAKRILQSACFKEYWSRVADYLKQDQIGLDLSRMHFIDSGWVEAPVTRSGHPLALSNELIKLSLIYEPKIRHSPAYITIGMSVDRKTLSPEMESKVNRLEKKLESAGFGKVFNVGSRWCASVELPQIRFMDLSELLKLLKESKQQQPQHKTTIDTSARITADKILSYVETTASAWSEIRNVSLA